MSMALGALSGIGKVAVDIGESNIKLWNAEELAAKNSELDTQKAKALEDYKLTLGDKQRTERVARVDTARTGLINQSVDQKYAGSDAAVAAANAGQTDAPLTPEQQAAIDQSKQADRTAISTDPDIRAQAAIKTGDISEHDAITLKKQDEQNATANKRLDQQQSFNEARAKIQDRLAAVAEARAGRADKRADTQMDKTELQSNRLALTSVLKDIGTQEDKIQVKLLDPMLDEKQKAVLEVQFRSLDKERAQAKAQLLSLAGIEPAKEPAAPARNGWDSATGEVFKDGKSIGTAKSEKEGRTLYQNFDPKKAEATPPTAKPGLISTPPQFNEAGYADVQGTIDGAKRGDKKAMELLPSLISRGMTNPSQRKQIAELTGQ